MIHTQDNIDIRIALQHLRAALAILDRTGQAVAAANLDHIIQTLDETFPHDRSA